jgi:hypothetical protein
MRTFDMGAVILDENFEGYRDWAEAADYYTETDSAGIATPSIAFDSYAQTGQRKHLALAINNTTGSAQDVRISFPGRGLGLWVHNTSITQVGVTMQFRYKADPALAGCSAKFHIANSAFAGTIEVAAPICDGEWHTETGTWLMQVDSSIFTGGYVEVTGIPAGAEGTFRVDDIRLTRVGNIRREIDSSAPIVVLRCDWGNGFRETYGWKTAMHRAHDGSEWREQLRLVPTCRLQYSVVAGDAATAGFVDQWLYRYHGAVVAVPRWADAVPLSGIESSGHEVFTSENFTSRWFQPRQRFLLWRSETEYEAELIDTINDGRITLDPNEGAVDGDFPDGTLIVPLVPARLAPELPIRRPNGATSVVDLTFDVQMVQ